MEHAVSTVSVSGFNAWVRLLRLPNLLTVAADPLVLYLLAGGRDPVTAALACAVVSVAYLMGLVTNDLADLAEDRKERHERPLPSGAISVRAAWIAAVFLTLLSLGLAVVISFPVFFATLLLIVLIAAYNLILKRSNIAGPAGMGLCRITGLLIGFTAAVGFSNVEVNPLLCVPFVAHGSYIFGLSRLAYDETRIKHKVSGRFGLLFAAAIPLAVYVYLTFSPDFTTIPNEHFFMILAILILIFGFRLFVVLSTPFATPKMIQEGVREIISAIPAFQACWILLSDAPHAPAVAIVLLLAAAAFLLLTRRIAAT